jgi:hypothetical protein
MSVLTVKERTQRSIEFSERVRTKIPNEHNDKAKQNRTSRLLPKTGPFKQNHREKKLNIRHQLDSGTYYVNERLDVVIDRLIENLISKRMEENEAKSKTWSWKK